MFVCAQAKYLPGRMKYYWIMGVVDVVFTAKIFIPPYANYVLILSELSRKKVGVGLYLDRLHFCTIFTKLLLLT